MILIELTARGDTPNYNNNNNNKTSPEQSQGRVGATPGNRDAG